MSAGRGPRIDLPRVDLHSHVGRCFLAGLPAGHALVAALDPAAVADAVRAAQAAGMTALTVAAVADFAVLRPDPETGLRVQPAGHRGRLRARQLRHDHGRARGIQPAGDHLARPARRRRDWGVCTECGMGRANRDEIPALLDLHRQIIAAR